MRRIHNILLALLTSVIIAGADVPVFADEYLTVTAVGDIMTGSLFPGTVLPPNDGQGMFDPVQKYLSAEDIVFANLEGVFLDEGISRKCRYSAPGRCFAFRMPERYAIFLKKAGFNAVGIANNHTFDFGHQGLNTTIRLLKDNGVQPVGGDYQAGFSRNGKKIIILGFSYSDPSPHSYSILDLQAAAQRIKDAKKANDIVIVSFHGGAEGRGALHIYNTREIFLGQKRGNVISFARTAVDSGADLVIGHGPHVLRAMELYRNKLIMYSLGNFLTYGMFNIKEENGVSAIVRARLSLSSGDFIDGDFIPVRLLNKGIPEPDPAAIELVNRLIRDDLPASGIEIIPVKDSNIAKISIKKKN
jgi:poly-gamma-glutamate capsule biosynthesis protein CapA/YwtB (metallophosphatase superfamily)